MPIGPSDKFHNAEEIVMESQETSHLSEEELETRIASFKLQNSYMVLLDKVSSQLFNHWVTDWKMELQ